MLFGMEHKKTVDPSEITFLGIWRVISHSHGNQVFPVNIREFPAQSVSGIFHCLFDHFVASGHGRMVLAEGFCAGEPVVPLNLISPRQFQAVTKKESERIDFLPELPFIDMRISSQITQPGINSCNGMFPKSRIGMVGDEELDMPSIPGNGPLGDAKKFQYITVSAPENLNSGICGRFSSFHETSRSVRLDPIENKYRTYGGII